MQLLGGSSRSQHRSRSRNVRGSERRDCQLTSARSAAIETERPTHRSELRIRLGHLGGGIRIGHDPGPGEQPDPVAVLELPAAQGDAELAIAAPVHPPDGTGVATAIEGFELIDMRHRARLRVPADGGRRVDGS